jgi:alpha-D-xyloside xylohydrolase
LTGIYHEDASSFLEHNLYPLRYNKTVADVTREVTGSGTIYARSAWAGSQRYPLHWGGDAEITDGAMACTLRGGLSLGLCGFTFWSHFIGGFSRSTPAPLYLRWLAFGVLTSHSRCHGAPPTEPWEYGEEFVARFRRIVEMRYRLMPYVYAQAKLSSERGYPMLRTLFFEFPEDPSSWTIEDEYMFGEDVLVAPLMEEARSRIVYLPPGRWVDYQSAATYEGACWHRIETGAVPAVVLVRHGAVIPHIELAQSTGQMDWSELELAVFGADVSTAECPIYLPGHGGLHAVRLRNDGEGLVLQQDSLQSRVAFRVVPYA